MKCSDRKIGQIICTIPLNLVLLNPFTFRSTNPQIFNFPNKGKNILKKASLSVRINAANNVAFNWQSLKYHWTMVCANSGSQFLNLPQFANVSPVPTFFQGNERFQVLLDNYNPVFESVTDLLILDSFEDMFFACQIENLIAGSITLTAVLTLEYIEIQNMFN